MGPLSGRSSNLAPSASSRSARDTRVFPIFSAGGLGQRRPPSHGRAKGSTPNRWAAVDFEPPTSALDCSQRWANKSGSPSVGPLVMLCGRHACLARSNQLRRYLCGGLPSGSAPSCWSIRMSSRTAQCSAILPSTIR